MFQAIRKIGMKIILFLLVLLFIHTNTIKAQWISQNFEKDKSYIRNSCFIDKNNGWLLIDGNQIFRTINGGEKWDRINTLPYFLDVIKFVDPLNGWGTGDNIIAHTKDGGNSWTVQFESINTNETFQQFRDVFFTDKNHGWVVGYAVILITDDGGETWIPTQLDIWAPWSVFFQNQDIGWIVSFNGEIIKTLDGGHTWSKKTTIADAELHDVVFTDLNNGCAVGTTWRGGWQTLIIHTTNGGETWDILQLPDAQILYSVSFADSLNGWASGSTGTIWHTSDGGKKWDAQKRITSSYLFSINFIDKNIGWAAGQNTILKTTNGGIDQFNQIQEPANKLVFTVYPNPVRDLLHIKTSENKVSIEMYNITGNLLLKENCWNDQTIDISDFSKGIYILRSTYNDRTTIEKITKE